MRFLTPILSLIGVLLAVSLITFCIQSALPGDAAEVRVGKRDDLTTQQRDQLVNQERKVLGLDKPLPVQFLKWLQKAVQFDFGDTAGGTPVRGAVAERVLPSLELALATLIVSLPIAMLLAVATVRRGRRLLAALGDSISIAGFVIPSFWLGILLVLLFAIWLRWIPASGYVYFSADPWGHLERLFMPLVTLSVPTIALYYNYLRQSLKEALASQYVRTARAKGISETRMLYRHALPNALLPSLTVLGIQFGQLLGGVVIIERVFNWPGVGGLLLYSQDQQDYATLVACVLAIATAFVVMSTLIEISYRLVDPRMRRA
jgi:peptide/nickel transport system permease protein